VTVARAKRTTRAEARRRYRAEQGLPEEATALDDADDSDATTPRQTRAAPDPAGRLGIGTALRMSFRPLDIRGDIQALPQLIRDKSFFIPILLTLGSTLLVLVVHPQPATKADTMTLVASFLFQ
jgi:hypothetical protein